MSRVKLNIFSTSSSTTKKNANRSIYVIQKPFYFYFFIKSPARIRFHRKVFSCIPTGLVSERFPSINITTIGHTSIPYMAAILVGARLTIFRERKVNFSIRGAQRIISATVLVLRSTIVIERINLKVKLTAATSFVAWCAITTTISLGIAINIGINNVNQQDSDESHKKY